MNCLFCRLAAGQIPAQLIHEDADVVAFHDIAPQAPVHVLVIPRRHLDSLAATTSADDVLLGQLLATVRMLAHKLGVSQTGYRTVLNTGSDGGQSVGHLHAHLLAGRALGWPPG